MSTTRLLVVRHGETAWNVEGRIQGHVDIALNALGQAQARALGERLLHDKFDAVYSSDLQRPTKRHAGRCSMAGAPSYPSLGCANAISACCRA